MQSYFRVFEEFVFFDLWIPDLAFRILVSGSGFRIPDSKSYGCPKSFEVTQCSNIC